MIKTPKICKKLLIGFCSGLLLLSSISAQSGGIVAGITDALNQFRGEGEGEQHGPDINGSEKAAAEAVKAELDAKNLLDSLKTKLAKATGDTTSLKKQIEEAKIDLAEKHAKRIEAAEKVIEAYRDLGDTYARAGKVGDPVQIGTGEYIYSKNDFEAEDFLSKFTINRNYKTTTYSESFGKDWTCSLDSRIVRGKNHDTKEIISKLNSQKTSANEYLTQLNNFYNTWGHYPEADENPVPKIEQLINEINQELEIQQAINIENTKTNDLNKFSAYGYFSNPENLILGSDILVFIDENGNRILCKFSENGIWKPINEKQSLDFYITEDNGYSVIFRNGTKKYYSKYGILEKNIDRNNNITSFTSVNGFINSIKTKTGEIISIERNNKNQIIKIYGETSGTAQFLYSQDYLIFVCSNKNLTESYKYNTRGLISEIKKAPNNSILIDYEYYSSKNEYLVSKVTNQVGDAEFFSYDFPNHKVFHTTYAGNIETYELNDDGTTKAYINDSGVIRQFEFNEKNQISAIYENSNWKYFSYDNFYQPCQIYFEDGSTTLTKYNEFGEITFQSDKDGFTNEYFYDEKGNLTESRFCDNQISSIRYYPNGLIKSVDENQNTYLYEYNSFGKITKKTKIDFNHNTFVETWKYDSKNRLLKYTNYDNQSIVYTYDENSMTEISSNKKIEHIYDYRNLEIELKETDLKSGTTLSKKTIYDGIGRPVEILLNNTKYRTFEYNKSTLMTSCTTWNLSDNTKGIKKIYDFDSKNRFIRESCCYIDGTNEYDYETLYNISYEDTSDGFVMSVAKGSMAPHHYFYNNQNQLVKIIRPNGDIEVRTYTKNGKIDSINSNSCHIDFTYTNQGMTELEITNFNNTVQNLCYNKYGNLIYKKDFNGSEWNRYYNQDGLLIEETGPAYSSILNYDNQNRVISEKVFDVNKNLCFLTEYKYDDENLILTKICGEKYYTITKYDCWGRPIEIENENGKSCFGYDILGNCIYKKDSLNNTTDFVYDCFGNLTDEIKNGISVVKNEWSSSGQILTSSEFGFIKNQWTYDESGNCICITDDFGNQQNFTIDVFGYISSSTLYDNGKIKIDRNKNTNQIIYSNESGFNYIEEFDEQNNLIAEINSFGEKSFYSYNPDNTLSGKTDFEGNTYSYIYLQNPIVETTIYNSSEIYEIEKNPLGFIKKLSTPEGSIEYIYDIGSKLIEVKDNISRISVFYDYDKWGRCVGKRGDNFSVKYDYNKNERPTKIYNSNDGSFIDLEYDIHGREIKRIFSNGINISSEYNDFGQKIASVAKEPYGVVITGEYIIYDDKGKILLNIDKNGKITKYDYDSKGRLISTLYNYSDEIIDSAKQEAIECGIYISEERPKGSVLNLSHDEYEKAMSLLRKFGLYTAIDRNQYCWFEKYTYSNFGNIASVENPFGLIIYEYDDENRLIHKHGKQTSSGGIKYRWSKNGNLKSIESTKEIVEYKYGIFDRPIQILSKDFETGNITETIYTYDSLGRRISEEKTGSETHRFIYDGFSHNILIDTPVYDNKSSLLNYAIKTNIKESEKYRTLSNNSTNTNDFRTYENSGKNSENQIIFEEKPYISIFVNGSPAIYYYPSRIGSINGETEFIIMDNTSTSVKSIIDRNGNCMDIHGYNSWGEILLKNQVSGKSVCINNSMNILRNSILTYDLGNRDYIPSMKSFTTRDPKKAGFNWYAYCLCDPVNYKDIFGFEKSCLSPLALARYNEGVAKHLLFNEEEYHRTGMSAGISTQYDCADVSGAVDANASTYAGIRGYSVMADAYREQHNQGNYSDARKEINSWSFFTGDTDINVRQTSEGFNRNEYRKGNGQEIERANTYENLQNPDIISPGTVLVWTNPDHIDGKNWIGHTMTVLARDFDADGKVIGFAYIEGHVTGNKTELGYMGTNSTWKAGVATVDYWIGNFLGTFEIEGKNAIADCQ